jgi:hypothetical protein
VALCRSKDSQALIIPTAATIGGAYSDWASRMLGSHMPPEPRRLAAVIPPVKIARTHAGTRRNPVLEQEAE